MSLKNDLENFKDLPPQEQKQVIKVLQMAESEGLLSPPVSQAFLVVLKPESPKEQ